MSASSDAGSAAAPGPDGDAARGAGAGPDGGGRPWLVLWDIDGTLLLKASTSHAKAMLEALAEVHGLTPADLRQTRDGVAVQAAGMTDGQIGRALLRAAGVAEEDVDRRAEEVVARTYERYAPEDLGERLSPGIVDVLAALDAREDVVQSLVTGNYELVARRKLAAAGLDRFFDPRWGGGFGSDHEDRRELPAIARTRAGTELGGDPWPPSRTIVVGDTPRDVACARHDGVAVIGVTTGHHGEGDLAEADDVATDAASLGRILTTRLTVG